MSQLFLCHQDDIAEHQAQGFSIETKQGLLELFAIKYQDQIYAYKNHCPHLYPSYLKKHDSELQAES